MAELVFEARPPAEAVEYLEKKAIGGRFSFDWRDVWREEHLNSFVVAKAMSADILTDIHAGLVDAIKAGKTREQFIDELTPLLQARGWWGKQTVADPTTGELVKAQLGSPRRLSVIFDTNMRMAHAAARWTRIQDTKAAFPFLRYVAVDDSRTRPEHRAWHGTVRPVDDGWWSSHYPPCGWRCRCTVQPLNRRMMDRRGYEVTDKPPRFPPKPYLNRRTGETVVLETGIDPGFGYNVGEARLAGLVPPAAPEPQRAQVVGDRRPAALPELPVRPQPSGVRGRPDLRGAGSADVFDAFSRLLGVGEGGVFVDRAQVPIVIGRRMFEQHAADGASIGDKSALLGRGEQVEYLAETLRDPSEIWHSLQRRDDGSTALVRYYVAAFETEIGRVYFQVAYGHRDGVWWGVTAFGPGKRGKPANQLDMLNRGGRVGALVYRRK